MGLPDIANYYNSYQEQRLQVKPGIIGLSKLSGYTNKYHDKKIKDDLYYIQSCSVKTDAMIVYRLLKHMMK
ncbi:sugar transferase [Lentibacillus salicampi]|uniref:Bacterial sugar transferase domain-containing protein n=1 Tax=Lentibacillus salicampi TaxID=175306 RepID=A0A4Y9A6Y3_9BACI|nr:hypothetical protein E4U82_17415 [Lentibacillus salicampi]